MDFNLQIWYWETAEIRTLTISLRVCSFACPYPFLSSANLSQPTKFTTDYRTASIFETDFTFPIWPPSRSIQPKPCWLPVGKCPRHPILLDMILARNHFSRSSKAKPIAPAVLFFHLMQLSRSAPLLKKEGAHVHEQGARIREPVTLGSTFARSVRRNPERDQTSPRISSLPVVFCFPDLAI